MFCHKCGSKSLEGAVFCQKCGAKLIKGEEETQSSVEPVTVTASASIETTTSTAEPITTAAQTSVTPQPNAPTSKSTAEICDLLKEGLSHCPKIKTVSPAKKSNAIYNPPCNHCRVFNMGFASISWNFMDYGFDDSYNLPLAIGLLAVGLFLAAITFLLIIQYCQLLRAFRSIRHTRTRKKDFHLIIHLHGSN